MPGDKKPDSVCSSKFKFNCANSTLFFSQSNQTARSVFKRKITLQALLGAYHDFAAGAAAEGVSHRRKPERNAARGCLLASVRHVFLLL